MTDQTHARFPLQVAFDLSDFAVKVRAERHRREHPGATDDDVDAVVRAWLRDRPGAEHGDAEGRPGDLGRFS